MDIITTIYVMITIISPILSTHISSDDMYLSPQSWHLITNTTTDMEDRFSGLSSDLEQFISDYFEQFMSDVLLDFRLNLMESVDDKGKERKRRQAIGEGNVHLSASPLDPLPAVEPSRTGNKVNIIHGAVEEESPTYILYSTSISQHILLFDSTSFTHLLTINMPDAYLQGHWSVSTGLIYLVLVEDCPLTASQSFNVKTTIFTLSPSSGTHRYVQTLSHPHDMCVEGVELFERSGKQLMVVMTKKITSEQSHSSSSIHIYQWSDAHFDESGDAQILPPASNICVFPIHQHIYVAATVDGGIGSPVYRVLLDDDTNMFSLYKYQTIAVTGATSCIGFRGSHSRNYLAFSGSPTYIYSFIGSSFCEAITLPTSSATNIQALDLPGDSASRSLLFISSVKSGDSGISVYAEDFNQYTSSATFFPITSYSPIISVSSLQVFSIGNFIYSIQANEGGEALNSPYVYGIQVEISDEVIGSSASKEAITADETLVCLNNLRKQLIEEKARLDALRERLDSTLSFSKDQDISNTLSSTAELNIGNLEVVEGLQTDNLITPDNTTDEVNILDILSRINDHETDLELIIDGDMSKLITLSSDQTLSGTYIFKGMTLYLSGNSDIEKISNSIPISQLDLVEPLLNALYDAANQEIIGRWDVDRLTTAQSLLDGNIQGSIATADILLARDDQIIRSAAITFQSGFSANSALNISGHINGLDVVNDVVHSGGFPQLISGVKTITRDVTFADVSTSGKLQGIDISTFHSDVVLIDEDTTLRSSINFQASITALGNLKVEGLLNERDISSFNINILDVNSVQRFTGTLTVPEIIVTNGTINIRGTVNGFDVSDELLTVNGGSRRVVSRLVLDGGASFTSIQVNKLNDIDLLTQAVRRNGSNSIAIFHDSVTFTSDLSIDGDVYLKEDVLLNLLDISQLASETITWKLDSTTGEDPITIPVSTSLLFTSGLTSETLQLDSTLNGFDWESELVPDFVRLRGGENVQDLGSLIIPGGLTVRGDADVDRINDLRIGEDILFSDSGSTSGIHLMGEKTYIGEVEIRNDITVSEGVLINQLDISEIDKHIVKRDEDSDIRGKKMFHDISIGGDISNLGAACGAFIPSHTALVAGVEGIQIFTETIEISTVISQNELMATDLNITGLLNGITDVYNLLSNAALIDTDTNIDTVVEFNSDLQINYGTVVGNLHGTPWSDFLSRIINIEDDRTFDNKSPTEVHVTSAHFSNSLTFDTINSHLLSPGEVIFKSHEGEVFGDKQFPVGLEVNGGVSTSSSGISGISITHLFNTRLSRSRSQTLQHLLAVSPSALISTLILEGNPKPTINGVNTEAVALRGQPQHFQQEVTITRRAEFLDDVTVAGTIQEEKLEDVEKDAVSLSNPPEVKSPITIISAKFEGSVWVDEIDGVNVKKIAGELVQLNAAEDKLIINTDLTFAKGFLAAKGINFTKINGINLGEVYTDAAIKGTQHIVTGDEVFTSTDMLVEGDLIIPGDLELSGNLNNLEIGWLCDNLILTTQPGQIINSSVMYQGQVYIKGSMVGTGTATLNGLLFPEDLLLLHKDEILPDNSPSISFNNDIESSGEVFIKGEADGVNITNLVATILLRSVDQRLDGDIIFQKEVTVTGNFTALGDLNGINLSDEAVTTSSTSRYVISSVKNVNAPIEIKRLFSSQINGYLIDQLYDRTYRINEESIVETDVRFTGAVNIMSDAFITGMSDNNGKFLDLSVVTRFNGDEWYEDLTNLKVRHELEESILRDQIGVAGNHYKHLISLDLVQEIEIVGYIPQQINHIHPSITLISQKQLGDGVAEEECGTYRTSSFEVNNETGLLEDEKDAFENAIISKFNIEEYAEVLVVSETSHWHNIIGCPTSSSGESPSNTSLTLSSILDGIPSGELGGGTRVVLGRGGGPTTISEILTDAVVSDVDVVRYEDTLFLALAVSHMEENLGNNDSSARSVQICEGDEKLLTCSDGGKVQITSASYGFPSTVDECTVTNDMNISCSVDVAPKLQLECNGFSSCKVRCIGDVLDSEGTCSQFFLVNKHSLNINFICHVHHPISSLIYRLNVSSSTWQLVQTIPTLAGSTTVRFLPTASTGVGGVGGLQLLLGSREDYEDRSHYIVSYLLVWNGENSQFSAISALPTAVARGGVEVIDASTDLLLVVVPRGDGNMEFRGSPTEVYRVGGVGGRVSEYQELDELNNPNAVHTFTYSDVTYLGVVGKSGLVLYRWFGEGRFQIVLKIPLSSDGVDITTYMHNNILHLILLTRDGSVKVFKARTSGFDSSDLIF